MPDTSSLPGLVIGGAFVLAALFGAVAQRVGFCTVGAIADAMTFGDWRRMRMWMLAVAVAVAGTTALQGCGLIDLRRSLYTGSAVNWLSALVGGFMFGFGMTLASGCVSKTLIRVGGGSLKSLVVLLFMAVAAYMTLRGLFAPWRAGGLDSVQFDVAAFGAKTSDLGAVLAALGLGAAAKVWAGFVLAAALAAWTLASRDFRSARGMVVGGLALGAVIVGGWFLTAYVGYVAEDPQTLEERFVATSSGRPESFSFTGPVAAALELLLLWTDQSRTVTFGIAVVLGTLVGACVAALASGSFRWEGFASVEDVANHIGGGVLMGIGGITALGCTIGQGLTGVSTLAVGSFIALAAIVGGSVVALRYQMWRLERTGG